MEILNRLRVVQCAGLVVCLGLIGMVTCINGVCNVEDTLLEINSEIANLEVNCYRLSSGFEMSATLSHGQEQVEGVVINVCQYADGEDEPWFGDVESGETLTVRFPLRQDIINATCSISGCYQYEQEDYRFDSSGLYCSIVNNTIVPNPVPPTPTLPTTTTLVATSPTSYPVQPTSSIPPTQISNSLTKLSYVTTTLSVSYSSILSTTPLATPIPGVPPDPQHEIFLFLLPAVFLILILLIVLALLLLACMISMDKRKKNKMLMKMRLGYGLYLHTSQIVELEDVFDVTDMDSRFLKGNSYIEEEDCRSVLHTFRGKEDFGALSCSDNDTGYSISLLDITKNVEPLESDKSIQARKSGERESISMDRGNCSSEHTPSVLQQIVHDEIETAIATGRCFTREDVMSVDDCNNPKFEVDRCSEKERISDSPPLDLTHPNVSGYVEPSTTHYPTANNPQLFPELPVEGDFDLDLLSGPTSLSEKCDSSYIATAKESDYQTSIPTIMTSKINDDEIDFSFCGDLSFDYQPAEEYCQSSCQNSDDERILSTDIDAEAHSIDSTSYEQVTADNATAVSDGYIRSVSIAAEGEKVFNSFNISSHPQQKGGPPESSTGYYPQPTENNLLTSKVVSPILPPCTSNGYVMNDSLMPYSALIPKEGGVYNNSTFNSDATQSNLYPNECNSPTEDAEEVLDMRSEEEFSSCGIHDQWDTTVSIDLDMHSDSEYDPEYDLINTSSLVVRESHTYPGYITMNES